MSGIEVSVTSRDMRDAIGALNAAGPEVAKEWKRRARAEIAEPWAADLRKAAPRGRKGTAAGMSIQAAGGAKPAIVAGKGTWAGDHGHPWQPFFLMNYGGNRSISTYTRRRKRGGVSVVRRRVKTWALPHRRRGYWLEPAIRRTQPEQRQKVMDMVDRVVREVLS